MRIRLPNEIGKSAEGEDPSGRFVAAPLMAAGNKAVLHRAQDNKNISEVQKAFNRGAMPRRAGVVALSKNVVGAFDLQAFKHTGNNAKISPQSKLALDEETKEVKEPGAIVFSTMYVNDSLELDQFCSKAIGVAINPDEDPWLADELGIDPRWRQNKFGLVIVTTPPFAEGSFVVHKHRHSDSVISPQPSGELILPRSVY